MTNNKLPYSSILTSARTCEAIILLALTSAQHDARARVARDGTFGCLEG